MDQPNFQEPGSHLRPLDLIRDGIMTEDESRVLFNFFNANPAGHDVMQTVVARYLAHIADIRLLKLHEAARGSNPGFITSIRYWVVNHVDDFFLQLMEQKEQWDRAQAKVAEKKEKGLPEPESEFT